MSSPALLLVDLQHDFLVDPRLRPPAALLVERAARLLEACRRRGHGVWDREAYCRVQAVYGGNGP